MMRVSKPMAAVMRGDSSHMMSFFSSKDIHCLNDDTLSEIVAFLSTQDCLRLSATSKRLHSVSRERALKYITITNATQLQSLCQLLLDSEDLRRRISVLRTLELSAEIPTLTLSSAALLAEFINHTDNCRVLGLINVETLIESDMDLGFSLVGLTVLDEVRFSDVGQMVLLVLQVIRSRPRVLSLAKVSGVGYDMLFSTLATPNFTNLRTLILDDPPTFKSLLDSPIPKIPSVCCLRLSNSSIPQYYIVLALPNIRELYLTDVKDSDKERQLLPRGISVAHWPSLDYLNIRNKVEFPLNCPVHRLNVHELFTGYAGSLPVDEPILIAAQQGSPVVVSLGACASKLTDVWPRLLNFTPRLRSLEFQLYLETWDDDSYCPDWDAFLGRHLPEIAKSKIVHIHIRLYPFNELQDMSHWYRRSLREVWLLRCLLGFVREMPSLRYFSFGGYASPHPEDDEDAGGQECYQGQCLWWRIAKEDGRRRAVRMDPFVGDQVRKKIHSSDYDWKNHFDDSEFFKAAQRPGRTSRLLRQSDSI
ncbi:uncharacterized protein LAESUDRAFT_57487 [Laetiporus sulphureus 93-53]|uniref:F-box domain-containing protein n=1 Tax=Laetiporus sulphureus 93-53 TaxID=1314785 RepID=A0A165AZK2_9APHY|nr:uncharacterized protein LAESUDRAFT_57487 [Laetiporus sulphureus 93-53]KZS99948.1 hypothetical protein LAESUDRAFT_57487 [Laetiporus sulphureus 93-53]